MATPVSSGALNLSASSATASSDTSRNAVNGTLKLSFSDLLHGQIQGGIDTRTPDIAQRPAPAPTRPDASAETPREASCAPNHSSTLAPKPQTSRLSQEPTRANGNPPEAGQAVKQHAETQDTPPPQQADSETGKAAESGEEGKIPENTASAERTSQPQLVDATVPPAMIAVLPNEIAFDPAEPDAETSTGNASTLAGQVRHLDTASLLQPEDAAESALQGDTDAEGNGQGTKPETTDAFMGRASRHDSSITQAAQDEAGALSGADKAAPARINATALNAANAPSMIQRETGHVQAVPVGSTVNGGEISILNPPRLPSQAGAVLPQFTIPAGAGQRAWAEEVGNRVMWMMGRAESRAELILTPPHLGKVEVSIHLSGDQSTAQFLASSQSAREALEQAMPRLRELLAQAGINLGEASVNTSAEGRTQDSENTRHMGMHAPGIQGGDDERDTTDITAPNWSRLDTGLINTFA